MINRLPNKLPEKSDRSTPTSTSTDIDVLSKYEFPSEWLSPEVQLERDALLRKQRELFKDSRQVQFSNDWSFLFVGIQDDWRFKVVKDERISESYQNILDCKLHSSWRFWVKIKNWVDWVKYIIDWDKSKTELPVYKSYIGESWATWLIFSEDWKHYAFFWRKDNEKRILIQDWKPHYKIPWTPVGGSILFSNNWEKIALIYENREDIWFNNVYNVSLVADNKIVWNCVTPLSIVKTPDEKYRKTFPIPFSNHHRADDSSVFGCKLHNSECISINGIKIQINELDLPAYISTLKFSLLQLHIYDQETFSIRVNKTKWTSTEFKFNLYQNHKNIIIKKYADTPEKNIHTDVFSVKYIPKLDIDKKEWNNWKDAIIKDTDTVILDWKKYNRNVAWFNF
jgi:hypothetical protein